MHIVINLCGKWINIAKYNLFESLWEKQPLPYQGNLSRHLRLLQLLLEQSCVMKLVISQVRYVRVLFMEWNIIKDIPGCVGTDFLSRESRNNCGYLGM